MRRSRDPRGVQSSSSLQSHLTALYGSVCERVRDALHTGIKQALAVMTSHYVGLNLQRISKGFVDMPDPELEKLVDAAEAPGAVLAARFEDEVVKNSRPLRPCNRLALMAEQVCGPSRPLQ
jgi:hypothetical protein